MSELRRLEVPADAAGKRLDLFVGEALGLSRARLKQLFDEGRVKAGGRTAKKGDRAEPGKAIEVRLFEEAPAAAPAPEQPLAVLYEDEALVFVDKPSKVPAHPLKPGETGTVANALVARYPECAEASEDPREGGLCHRLDVETSGVMVAARSRKAWEAVRAAFGSRAVEKRYWALVTGPIADEGEIDLPLRHAGRNAERMEAAVDGVDAREAVSRFRVLARQGELSLVEVQILTGVQHQIRAHLAGIGAPIVGDALYGGREAQELGRFFLHARVLALDHPVSGKRLRVESPLPEPLAGYLAAHGLTT